MATVNPVQATTYNLSSGDRPITFGAATNIDVAAGNAVYGSAAASWTVINQGALQGYDGIALLSRSSVTNAGSIVGAGGNLSAGVRLAVGGSVTNDSGGSISGVHFGIWDLQAAGARSVVANAGKISAAGPGVAIYGGVGNTLTNTGTISSTGEQAVDVSNGKVINGAGGQIVGGVVVTTGSVTNQKGGEITHTVLIQGDGTVTNAGNIVGASGTNAVFIGGAGKVVNQVGGTISGGVLTDGGVVSVTNGGTIAGGIILASGGGVTNYAGATIDGAKDGAYTTFGIDLGVSGSVSNAGYVSGVALAGGGSVINTGSITYVSVSGGAGDVTNSKFISEGVTLSAGGSVTNKADGTISAGGVYVSGSAGTLANTGEISGAAGVWLQTGGSVVNSGVISITGTSGGYGAGLYGAGTITNQAGGKISGAFDGVDLGSFKGGSGGGQLGNDHGGSVVGGYDGVIGAAGPVVVSNSGSITGNKAATVNGIHTGAGVQLLAGGTVTNTGAGALSGPQYGVYIKGGGTVTNAGKIKGTDAVAFTGAGANRLILQTGSVLTGQVVGSTATGATNALILQGSGAAGQSFQHFNTLNMQGPGTWTLGGTMVIGFTKVSAGTLSITGSLTSHFTIAAGATLEVGGAAHSSAQVVDQGALTNNGLIEVAAGKADVIGVVSGSGSAAIAGGTLAFGEGFTQNVAFTGASGVLRLARSQAYSGQITGFSPTGGSSLDLGDIRFITGTTKAAFVENGAGTGGMLTITDGTHTAHIDLVGDYSASTFTTSKDGHGGTTVVDSTKSATVSASVLPFIVAMAGFGAGGVHWVAVQDPGRASPSLLAATHASGRDL